MSEPSEQSLVECTQPGDGTEFKALAAAGRVHRRAIGRLADLLNNDRGEPSDGR